MTLPDLVDMFRAGELTREELFAALTKLLSADPGALREARSALSFDAALRIRFEAWLDGLRRHPAISLGGRAVLVTGALVSALAASENWSTLGAVDAAGHVARPAAPTLDSRAKPVTSAVANVLSVLVASAGRSTLGAVDTDVRAARPAAPSLDSRANVQTSDAHANA